MRVCNFHSIAWCAESQRPRRRSRQSIKFDCQSVAQKRHYCTRKCARCGLLLASKRIGTPLRYQRREPPSKVRHRATTHAGASDAGDSLHEPPIHADIKFPPKGSTLSVHTRRSSPHAAGRAPRRTGQSTHLACHGEICVDALRARQVVKPARGGPRATRWQPALRELARFQVKRETRMTKYP